MYSCCGKKDFSAQTFASHRVCDSSSNYGGQEKQATVLVRQASLNAAETRNFMTCKQVLWCTASMSYDLATKTLSCASFPLPKDVNSVPKELLHAEGVPSRSSTEAKAQDFVSKSST
jgi:hypothetical protein